MGTISVNRVAGLSLIFGPLIAFVFFLIEPGGLLIDSADVSDAVGSMTAKGANAVLTNITNIAIILALALILSGRAGQNRAGRTAAAQRFARQAVEADASGPTGAERGDEALPQGAERLPARITHRESKAPTAILGNALRESPERGRA